MLAPMERDAAIVLGAAVWPGGQPSAALLRRARCGTALLRDGRARFLVACGGVVSHPPTEASWIRRIALEAGVPDARILVDELSRDTFENALASADLLRRHGLRTAFVVSDRYHLPRALYLLRRLGVDAVGCSAEDAAPPLGARIRELVAWPWSMLRVAWRLRSGRPPASAGAMRD